MVDVNLERRAKRHLWAPEHLFFAVCSPGLEPLCAAELKALGLEGVREEPGGVEFGGRLDAAYMANLWLRTAGRILLRLKDFRVRRWEDLLRQAAGIPWEVLLAAGAPLRVQVALRGSPLKHEGSTADAVLAAAARRLSDMGVAPAVEADPGDITAQRVLVRGVDRRATISIDTSGEHLHRRGWRQRPGQAPLREDLAAALVMLTGYDGAAPLLDAMCGAGTLAIEAACVARRVAPALGRGLALESWPGHKAATWGHLRGKAVEGILPAAPAPIHARDISAPALNDATANADLAGVIDDLNFAKLDFFKAPPPKGPAGVVLINPPWGGRLGTVREAERFLADVGARLREAYRGWRAGVVLYQQEWARHLGLRDTAHLATPAGGRKITLVAGRVPG